MIRIAALLTCFNRKEKTLRCLKHLYSQIGLDKDFVIDVFLVDDLSTDGTSEAVKSKFPSAKVIKGNGKLFWNRGMHLAWSEAMNFPANFDFFLWLNDDTTLFDSAVGELLACAKLSQNKAQVICGAIKSEITGSFTYGGITMDGDKVLPDGTLQKCHVINGNCVLVSQEAFNLIGNLDPVFPHAIGDHDYGLRLIKAGGIVLTTREYVGYCERNERLPLWCYTETPLSNRLKALYSPLGNSHPRFFFRYELRHFGVLTALKHYISIHLRALMPIIWK